MHLYIASVLSSLLSGSNHFSEYFYIRHILTPYSFQCYFLIVFGRLFSFLFADKLLVCAIIVCSAFGFLYLARTVGPSGDIMALFAIPLLLSWPLGMGYYNYDLSLGLAFWALGFWGRAVSQRSHRLWLGFLLTIGLMALTHPLPILLVLAFAAFHILWRISQAFLQARRSSNRDYRYLTRFKPEILYLILASSSLAYITLYIGKHYAHTDSTHNSVIVSTIGAMARAQYLSFYAGSYLTTRLDRLSLYVILILATWLAIQGICSRLRVYQSTFGDVLEICTLLLAIALPFIPGGSNGVVTISTRLILVVWMMSLAAASGHKFFAPRTRIALTACACIYAIAVLAVANYRIRPVAVQLARIETMPVSVGSLTGIGLAPQHPPSGWGLGYDPYFWASARYFRRTRSTLLNSGWLYQNYIAVGSRANDVVGQIPHEIIDLPWKLESMLLHSPDEQRKILPHSDLLVFVGFAKQQNMLAEVRAIDSQEPQRVWACQNEDWYFVCTAPKLTKPGE